MNRIEQWKREKHGFDVWPDVLRYADRDTPMKGIDAADLERMKWHGVFCRKRDSPQSYMLRIRITGCELSAEQAKEIAYVAYRLGHGIIDITTRANIQVQGVSIRDVPTAVARLEGCGLTCKQTGHDNIRSVFCHPLSGIHPQELIDTRALCRDITALFVDSRLYSDLPRKLNIAVSGHQRHGIHLSWQQLEGLARLSKKWGDGNLRTTCEQGIVVINIPSGFRDAAATDAATLGLSPHGDTLAMHAMACTGRQFCNLAVTEAKRHMFQLTEKLRQRGVTLHGIRIHMSGCPSGCAQHRTADIGLKGVRVRRILGTREGFDVYLGGGIAGRVNLGLPYRLGVDADQLPQLIEGVVREYYLKHRSGQTFSSYWREELRRAEAWKVGDGDYKLPTWLCEPCGYQHRGDDPPIFCPKCAGLRRHFARLEEDVQPVGERTAQKPPASPAPAGFVLAARENEIIDRIR